MPAASAEKRARQRANKVAQKDPATDTIVPPGKTTEFASPTAAATHDSWPTPAPTTFTISYTPLSLSYPEPKNPAAELPTDAIRLTRDQLMSIMEEAYVHGTEHGWKANIEPAKAQWLAGLEEEVMAITGNVLAQAKLKCEQEFKRGFDEGRAAAIREESKRLKSSQRLSVHCGIQTDPHPSPRIDFNMQTETPELPPISLPAPHSAPFQWSDDNDLIPPSLLTPVLPPTSSSLPIRDFSDLRSGANPWQSLRSRKGRDRRRLPQPIRQHDRQRLLSNSHRNSNIQRTYTSSRAHRNKSYPSFPPSLAPLDWGADPRLLELSRVLRTLGWVPPQQRDFEVGVGARNEGVAHM
ncbi:hypothetical protein B0H34DRAFT_802692 [Crassisporium funariophilum]|nr:hypothetical protein B0H34DRAFT_802692 [Crassisporium funariophilum]